jgi:HEPN domain-containing protein
MAKIDDAYERLKAAERCKEAGDYAGAIREAQLCIELSLYYRVRDLVHKAGVGDVR